MDTVELELDLARNLCGPLNDDCKARLRRLIAKPNARTWEAAHGIMLSTQPWLTLWQAICELDPSYVGIGKVTDGNGKVVSPWKKIPPAELIVRAIRYATH